MCNKSKGFFASLFFNITIFSSLFIMGIQFTQHYFISKESLIGPIIILVSIFIYYLVFNKKLIINKGTISVFSISTIFFVYYIINTNSQAQLKPEYMIYLSIIYLIFIFIGTFDKKIISFPMWIVFIFIYSNLIFLPRLLSHMSFTHANSNGIIAFLLLFFCIINLKESNKLLRILNIYNTIFLILVLFIATSRAAMLAFFVVIFIYLVTKKLHKYTFYFVTALIILSQSFTLFYLQAKDTSLGTFLNELALKYTGKRFFTGRDRAWKESLEDVTQSGSVWTGLGNNIQHDEFNGYLHNVYVQLFYQSGIIGILLMSGIFLTIAFIATKVTVPEIDHTYKTLFSYFTGILFLQIFEGHLIYKFEIISLLCWIIMALFVNKIVSPGAENVRH